MASTYSSRLRLELIATGEKSGSWGTVTNTNLGTLLEESIAGVAAVVFASDANYTLTTQNGSTDEARRAVLECTSGVSLTATRDLICPTASKIYLVYNNTTGGQSIRIKTSAGTGITITNGKKRLVYCDGTNVVDAITDVAGGYFAGGTDVAVADGGTGASTASAAATNLGLGTGDSPQFTAVNIGHATDTTVTRVSAGDIAVEGNAIYRAGGTDVPVTDGGTGASSASAAATNLGLGTGNSPQFTGIELGHATDTTLTRSSAGNMAIEGNLVYRAGGTDVPVTDGGTGASTAGAAATNLGLGTGDSPQFTAVNIGNATDTTVSRLSAGVLGVEGIPIADETWTIAVSDETTTITTGTNKATFVFPYNVTVVSVGASVNTVSSSGTPTFDINEGGTTILSTKITIDANEKTSLTAAAAPVISDSAIVAGAEVGIDIDVAGTGAKGAKVWMIVRRTS